MNKRTKVLICPLDWGLGHATRCIPIINELIKQDADVYIAVDKAPFDLLIREYPQLKFLTFPGIQINYPNPALMIPYLLFLFPKMLVGIKKENKYLQDLIDLYKFDVVISDNRYGLWNKSTRTVFITHQVTVKTPFWLNFLTPLLFKLSKYFIDKYNYLWIPDNEDDNNNLTGDLSHKYQIKNKSRFVGILSRFNKTTAKEDFVYDICAIISGPEQQRMEFKNLILPQLKDSGKKCVVISGNPIITEPITQGNMTYYPHLKKEEMQKVIEQSKIIISRSGYSTIMDLSVLEKNAIFIPTPGQTEQEYLAQRLMKKGIIYSQKQKSFNLKMALEESQNYKGLKLESSPELLANAIKEVLKF